MSPPVPGAELPDPRRPRRGGPPARRNWVLPVTLVAIIGLPIIEIWTLLRVGGWIGFWPTLLVILVLTGVGGWLVSREGRKAWAALTGAVSRGLDPGPELTDGVLVLTGGLLMLLPGFLTDIAALVFLLPFTRPLPRVLLRRMTRGRPGLTGPGLTGSGPHDGPDRPRRRPPDDGLTIEGEIDSDS